MNNDLTILMDLRLSSSILNKFEDEKINYLIESSLDDDLNFAEELMTSATIVGVTSALLTSIVSIIKHLVPANKKVEMVQGDKRYNFENYDIEEIEKLINIFDEKAIIEIRDAES